MTAAEKRLLRRVVDFGEPTYIDRSRSRVRDGKPCCFYCRGLMSRTEESSGHSVDCVWLQLQQVLGGR